MVVIHKEEVNEQSLPGRRIKKVVGKDSYSVSDRMSMGFARYSAESGKMQPHRHAEEIIFVLDVRGGYVRYGTKEENLDQNVALSHGMVLHIPEGEWHVFEYEEGGFVDVIFFYGQVEGLRQEDIKLL
jgi:hypothetical protein